MSDARKKALSFFASFALLLLYFWRVYPAHLPPGLTQDFCFDVGRQALAENFMQGKGISFFTPQFAAPEGIRATFLPWILERDLFGAFFWIWNRDFPFQWFSYVASLSLLFFFLGWLLPKFKLPRLWAWPLALAIALFHISRHNILWRDCTQYGIQHWLYLGVFLDAWIYLSVRRDRIWPLHHEVLRLFFLVATLGNLGHQWGPALLSFLLTRFYLVLFLRGNRVSFEWRKWPGLFFVGLLLSSIGLQFYWFAELLKGLSSSYQVLQPVAWAAQIKNIFFPLIFNPTWMPLPNAFVDFLSVAHSLNANIGWTFWLPTFVSIFFLIKKKRLAEVLPFLTVILIALAYMQAQYFPGFVKFIQTALPVFAYFRNSSSWAFYLPVFCAALCLLAFTQLETLRKPRFLLPFLTILALESTWLWNPVELQPELPVVTKEMLLRLKQAPGDTVLDLPFCLIGANDVCGEQCPFGFDSNVGQVLRRWHDKRVYGLYAGRLLEKDCEIYRKAPFQSWFHAWAENRCFQPQEWKEFCSYLNKQDGLAAILLYPDTWPGKENEACLSEFQRRLGTPMEQGTYFAPLDRPKKFREERIIRFNAKCK